MFTSVSDLRILSSALALFITRAGKRFREKPEKAEIIRARQLMDDVDDKLFLQCSMQHDACEAAKGIPDAKAPVIARPPGTPRSRTLSQPRQRLKRLLRVEQQTQKCRADGLAEMETA